MAGPTKDLDTVARQAGDAGLSLRAHAPTVQEGSTPRYFDADLKMLPGIHLPLKSMLVETTGRGSVLISPVGCAEEAAGVAGRTLTVLAPSLLHHLHIPDAIARYHPVEVWGPPGLAAKRPELGPIKTIGVDEWPHADTLDVLRIEGAPRRNELVCFHRASRTIYTADVFFNLHHPANTLTSIAYRLMGTHDRFVMPIMWKAFVRDRAAFRRSLERMLEWDFDRVACAHGELVTKQGKSLVVAALQDRGYL